MRYQYFLCDVFSDRQFGGNQLAVLPEAQGLSTEQMQRIAREFNFSESAFVFPAEEGGTRKVRIFTPQDEMPFAGHPNIGTAFVLAATGALGEFHEELNVVFEEQAGPVPIKIRRRGADRIWCELAAPEQLSVGPPLDVAMVARAASLDAADLVVSSHAPAHASVGLRFVIAQVSDRQALERARPNNDGSEALVAAGISPPYLLLYAKSEDDFDLRVRMFSPLDGIPEDPATGSANCALAGLLTQLAEPADGNFAYRIAQGGEMGRPSVLEARALKRGGKVETVWIGGESVMFAEGHLDIV